MRIFYELKVFENEKSPEEAQKQPQFLELYRRHRKNLNTAENYIQIFESKERTRRKRNRHKSNGKSARKFSSKILVLRKSDKHNEIIFMFVDFVIKRIPRKLWRSCSVAIDEMVHLT